jgi:predicted metal-binding membrane protein
MKAFSPIAQLSARRGPFVPLMAGLIVLLWLALLLWQASPYGRYLDHGRLDQIGIIGALCAALPAGEIVLPALLYAGGWVLMTAAMMLPTTLPLIDGFVRLTAGRPDRRRLVGLLVVGYLVIWGVFGLAAHGLGWVLYLAVEQSAWLTFNAWVLGAGVLIAAGLFQFTDLKYHCLDRCRSPVGFLVEHWRGRSPSAEALRLGIGHGAFCVGCCWALMSLMFVVGTGNLAWMLALGAVMAVEKNMTWGRRLSAPLGVVLLAWAGVLVWTHLAA